MIVKCLTPEFRPVAISLRHLIYAKPLIPKRTEPLPALFQFEQHEVSPLALELFLYALYSSQQLIIIITMTANRERIAHNTHTAAVTKGKEY